MTYTIESISEYVNECAERIIIFRGIHFTGTYVSAGFPEKSVLKSDIEKCAGDDIVEKTKTYIEGFLQEYDNQFSTQVDVIDFSELTT